MTHTDTCHTVTGCTEPDHCTCDLDHRWVERHDGNHD